MLNYVEYLTYTFAMQVRDIIIEELVHLGKPEERTQLDENGDLQLYTSYSWTYTLPALTLSGENITRITVCGNAFARAYAIGKNSRTKYQSLAEKKLRKVPQPATLRTAR
jgi:hypothetical protein